MIQFPVWIIGVSFLVISVVMFYSNYGWRTKIMKENYSICGLENLPPFMVMAVGIMFLTPYLPVTMVV
jgi:hypothetical protein